MRLSIVPQRDASWPPLAWLAICRAGEPTIRLRHGDRVEIRDQWFCEAVWDGDFAAGDFDTTDLVFGSGGRLRDGECVFVSSGCTVDRLQYLWKDDELYVSNSLACLMACAAVEPDLTFDDYPEFFRSITRGIDDYQRSLPVRNGASGVELVYFRNLVWNGLHVLERHKPDPVRDFTAFDLYRQFLSSALGRIASNMADETRRHRYEMIGALSSGYDSTTAAVLAREVGLRQVFSFLNARGGQEDHGERVAQRLGLQLTLIERQAWREQPLSEIPYFAATGLGPDVIFSGARELIQGRVLVTGFHGDKVWGKDTKALGRNLVRGDASGLSFTEHRLMLGAIHLPVAFMGVRDIEQVHALSNSAELSPWDVGGDYSRPVCRRIVEDAGVPRDWFGRNKMAATSLFLQGESQLGRDTERAFHAWLGARRRQAIGREALRIRPPVRAAVVLRDHYHVVGNILRMLQRLLGSGLAPRLSKLDVGWQRALARSVNPTDMLFPFSIDRMREVYVSASARSHAADRHTQGHRSDDSLGRRLAD
ncbi:MAG: hypothetical protein HXY24_10290 [Rubrivivax sp.]|nr:hypothetical protein [Rubrivivax sp.]